MAEIVAGKLVVSTVKGEVRSQAVSGRLTPVVVAGKYVPGLMIEDTTPLSVTLETSAPPIVHGLFSVTAVFSEAVSDFVAEDVTVTNGTLNNFAGTGLLYTFDVTPETSGEVRVEVPAGVCEDKAGNKNTAATPLVRERAVLFGAKWTKGTNPALERLHDAIGMVAQAGVSGGPAVRNDFDDAPIYGQFVEVVDAADNRFIRVPKVYIRETDSPTEHIFEISNRPFLDAQLPWCFWDFATQRELDYIDIGKYPASLDSGNKLASKPGIYPLINVNIVNARTYARNNGPGYQQLDIHVQRLLQVLFYIEFATLDAQAIMAGFSTGQWYDTHRAVVAEAGTNRVVLPNAQANAYLIGQHIGIGTSLGGNQVFYGREILDIQVYDASNKALVFSGAPVNIAIDNRVYNVCWPSDFSGWIDASSGSLVSNATGKWPMMYRGIENWYGGLWWWVDGVNILDWQAWVCYNAEDFASNVFVAPYTPLSYANWNANGYVTDMGFDPVNPFAQFPVSVSGSHVGYRDHYYQAAGARAALVGGYLRDGVYDGPSCWLLLYAASGASANFGARLLRKPLL